MNNIDASCGLPCFIYRYIYTGIFSVGTRMYIFIKKKRKTAHVGYIVIYYMYTYILQFVVLIYTIYFKP